jgi:membrane fusion protein
VTGQLFRQEALIHQSERHWGECSHSSPVGMAVLTILILMLVFICCWFLVAGEYHRKTSVSGVLVSDGGTVQIRAPTEGIVEELSVGQGERVGKGDILLIITQGLTALDGNALGSKLLNENLHQQELLRQMIDGDRESLRIKVRQLLFETLSLERQKSWMESLLANEESAGDLLKQKYQRLMSLGEKNLMAANDIEASRFEWLKQDSQVQQLRLDLESILKTIADMNDKKLLLALEHQQQAGSLKNDLTELHKQQLQLVSDQTVRIVSPVDGQVSLINTQADLSVLARQVLLSVVQENSELEAELFIPSRAIGFVDLGQVVNLRIDAYSYQKFGIQRAIISEVSQTILLPAETGSAMGIKEPFYKVKAQLEQSIQDGLASQVMLKPGMQFSADIVLESRSLLEWLLEPLILHAGKR